MVLRKLLTNTESCYTPAVGACTDKVAAVCRKPYPHSSLAGVSHPLLPERTVVVWRPKVEKPPQASIFDGAIARRM